MYRLDGFPGLSSFVSGLSVLLAACLLPAGVPKALAGDDAGLSWMCPTSDPDCTRGGKKKTKKATRPAKKTVKRKAVRKKAVVKRAAPPRPSKQVAAKTPPSDSMLSVKHLKTGMENAEKGAHNQAIAEFTKAIELNPKLFMAFLNRGATYANTSDFDAAVADYTTAIALNPNFAKAYNERAIVYTNKGEFAPAIADYNKAIELDPQNANFFKNRAIAYEGLGNKELVIADYRAALTIDPTMQSAKDGLARLGAAATN